MKSEFEEWFDNDPVASAPPAKERGDLADWDAHVRNIAEMSWKASREPEIPSSFVTPDRGEQICNELVGHYLMMCGCKDADEIRKAALKLLSVVDNLVDAAIEEKDNRIQLLQ